MRDPLPLDDAAATLRAVGDLPEDGPIPTPERVLDAIERFAATPFAVSPSPEADGLLFQYGTLTSTGPAAFVIGFVRQFDVVDSDDDHEYYLHVVCELRYPPDEGLAAAGRHEAWWFADGRRAFTDWYAEVRADPIWRELAGRSASGFTLAQESV